MSQKTVTLNAATIGPAGWRNDSLNQIKLARALTIRSNDDIVIGKASDPLPQLRETVAELSNDQAKNYFRSVRQIVLALRESLVNTNEEIKALTRGKEALEKTHSYIIKDIKVNHDSVEIRKSRPSRERVPDGADDLLHAEKMHLLNLKKMIEKDLQLVKEHLKQLDVTRQRLNSVIKERSKVLDLTSYSVSTSARLSTSGPTVNKNRVNSLSGQSGRYARMSGQNPRDMFGVDALGPFTPACEEALQDAQDARARGVTLRKQLSDTIQKVGKTQEAAHKAVNSGLIMKVAETASLKDHLQVANGESSINLNRAQRWYNHTEQAWEHSKGPVMFKDITTRERFNRPIIKVMQRHPGNNMPEAQAVIKGGDGLLRSLHETSKNIGLIKLAKLRLKDDLADKHVAVDVDSQVIRMRRRKSDHRWAIGAGY